MKKLREMIVLGLNSGTSMDGIDAGVFRLTPALDREPVRPGLPAIDFEILDNCLFQYDGIFRKNLLKLIAGAQVDLRTICLLNASIGDAFADAAQKMVNKARAKGLEIDLIGSHGQTIWHAPDASGFWGTQSRGTLQVGDISVIAQKTGIPTIGDFRTADMALGGQGAPLVSFADEVLFASQSRVGNTFGILNLGGIANITVVVAGHATMAFDTGPANVLIDLAVHKLFGKDYDKNGEIAASGRVDEEQIEKLLAHPYIHVQPPKTTGRELFGEAMAMAIIESCKDAGIEDQDIVATLTAFTARSIAYQYRRFIEPQSPLKTLVLAGGGAQNPVLVDHLRKAWPHPLDIVGHETFGIDPKYKEALLFALLAYTTFHGIPNNVPACTGASRPACLGKLAIACG